MNRITSCTPSHHIKYDPEYYKVVFFSSAPIGVPFLEELHNDKRFDVVGVVTNPDQKSGRGMQLKENIIKTVGKKIEASSSQTNPPQSPFNKGEAHEGVSPLIKGEVKEGFDDIKPNLLILHGYNSSEEHNFFKNLKQKTEKL